MLTGGMTRYSDADDTRWDNATYDPFNMAGNQIYHIGQQEMG